MMRTVDFNDLLDTARRRIALPLLGLLAGLAAAQAVSPLLPARYEAHASVLVVADTPEGDRPAEMSLALAQNLAPTVAKLIGSREVAVAAAGRLGLPEEAVTGNVHGTFEPGLQIVTVRADAASAGRAAAIANAVSQAMGEQLERLKLGGDTVVTTRVVDTASVPTRPAFPKPLLNSALGALVGLLAGWGATVLRDRFDRRLRDIAQMESRLGLPVVGGLPHLPKRFARHHAAALFARREIATSTRATVSALSVLTTSSRRRLLVTSAHDDDGATLVSALLGLAMAAERRKVTVIDAAVRDPALAGHFPDASFTWQQVRTGQHAPVPTPDLPTLTVLPTEPRESLTTVHARELGQLLDVLADTEDCVIVHAPPVLAGCDTATLADHVDGVLLVVAAGQTNLTEAARAARLVRRLNLPLAGIVAVGAIDRVGRPGADEVPPTALPGSTSLRPVRRVPSGAHRVREVPSGGVHRARELPPVSPAGPPTSPEPARTGPPPGGDQTVPVEVVTDVRPTPARVDHLTPAPARVDHLTPTPPRQAHPDVAVTARWRSGPPSPIDDVVPWSTPLVAGGREAVGSALGRPLAPRAETSGRVHRSASAAPIEPAPLRRPADSPVAPQYVRGEPVSDLDHHRHITPDGPRWPSN
ncbi:hypothetical protein ABZ738_24565 [Micromonospora sp. NPDC047793]|uniref:hypothetical protein n=1 Tax=Micromonospora sp. NPDC047793 TaxID=3154342 RepID=UPI0033F5035F